MPAPERRSSTRSCASSRASSAARLQRGRRAVLPPPPLPRRARASSTRRGCAALAPGCDPAEVRAHLETLARVAAGEPAGGRDRRAAAVRALPLAGRAVEHDRPAVAGPHRAVRRPGGRARAPVPHAGQLVLQLVALALAALVGGAAQSATGFGVVLPLAPVMFALEDPPDAVLTIAIIALAHNMLIIATRRRALALRRRDAALLIAAALPGLVAGALVVDHLPKAALQIAVGVTLLAALAVRAHQPGRSRRLATTPAGAGIGLLSGTMTTTVAVNGPPLVIWLRARHATIAELRDTLAVIFFALNAVAIVNLALRGAATPRPTSSRRWPPGWSPGTPRAWPPGPGSTRPCSSARCVVLLVAAATSSIVAGVLR